MAMAEALRSRSFPLHSRRAMALLLAAATAMRLAAVALGAQYTVGDSSGWGLGNDLQSWASELKFQVGDDLSFSYPSGQHSVLLVTEDDYNSCNTESPITSDNGEGDMVITLVSAQTYFFICGVPGHCEQGLRLKVDVEPDAPITPSPEPDEQEPPPAAPTEEVHGPPPAAPKEAEHDPAPPQQDEHDPAAPQPKPNNQNTQTLSPPYYSKYNTFHRNASPKLAFNTLPSIAAIIFSTACAVAFSPV